MKNWYKIALCKIAASYSFERFMTKEQIAKLNELETCIDSMVIKYLAALDNKDLENQSANLAKADEILNEIDVLSDEKKGLIRIPKQKYDEEIEKTRIVEEKNKRKDIRNGKNIHKIGPKLEELARAYFPTTDDPRTAGYILSNGDMLHFSYGFGKRDVDHRQILEAFPEKMPISGGTDGMKQFMQATNAVRMGVSSDSSIFFDFENHPTNAQLQKIREVIDKVNTMKTISVSFKRDYKEFDRYDFEGIESFLS
jgi:hypothetical protein